MKRLMLLTLIVALLLTAPTFAQTAISLSSQSKSTDLLTLISLDRVKDAEKIEEIIGGFKGKSIELYLGPAEKSDSRYGRSFKQLLVLSQPILQSNLRSSARAKKELKGSAAGAQRSLPG